MRRLKGIVIWGLCWCAFIGGMYGIAQDADRSGNAVTEGLSVGDVQFAYTYPVTWRETPLEALNGRGSAVALVERDELGLEYPVAVTALFLAEADRALDVFQDTAQFPFEILSYTQQPEPLVLDERDAAVASVRVVPERDSFILSIQVEAGIFLVAQTVSAGADLEPHHDAIFEIAQSVTATLPHMIPTAANTLPPQPTAPPQECPYIATVTLNRLRVLSAEEAGTGRDFGLDGDQTTLTLEIGPVVGERTVNGGTRGEFVFPWTANLFGGNIREGIGVYSRHVCDEHFGLVIYAYEDDSTPFSTILTPLGSREFYPLVVDGEPVEYSAEIFHNFRGESQDGSYDYELNFSVALEVLERITTADLTPTVTPSNTPTATDTATPTITPTPSSTFTLTPSATYTPSSTPTATDTPTATLTPSNTPTPSDTPTPSITPTASDTPTPSDTPTVTQTPSRTPTPTDTHTPTVTSTATDTLTPSATFTPSNTPTATDTPTATLTPSMTPTPSDTPTPTPVDCPQSLPSRFVSGIYGRVTPGGDANRLRSDPALSALQIGTIDPGEIFEVVGDPLCRDGYVWLEVRYRGSIGWTAESSIDGYWVEPLPGAAAHNPDACTVTVNGDTNKRSGPGTNFEIAGQLLARTLSDVIARTRGGDGLIWYQLGDETWMREDVVIERGLCNAVPEVES